MSKTIMLAVDAAHGEPGKHVAAAVDLIKQLAAPDDKVIADSGHIARAILATAIQEDARMLVLGSSSRTDLPWVPFGGVASRLLHISPLPVLIVPMRPAEAGDQTKVADVTEGVA
jgi:nucleotide-binding universal stress UspA family protein